MTTWKVVGIAVVVFIGLNFALRFLPAGVRNLVTGGSMATP